jgi:transposase-like protein
VDVKRAADLYAQGRSVRQIGAELGISPTTVSEQLRRVGVTTRRGPPAHPTATQGSNRHRSRHAPASLPVVSEAAHGTSARWHAGCRCTRCRRAHSDTQRAWGRARAQKRLAVEVRQQLLDAIDAGQPFRAVLRDLGLTSNRVFGLTRTDQEWSEKLDAALTAARREDLQHGTNAAYLHRLCLQRLSDVSARQDGRNR